MAIALRYVGELLPLRGLIFGNAEIGQQRGRFGRPRFLAAFRHLKALMIGAAMLATALCGSAMAETDRDGLYSTMDGRWAIDNTFNCHVPNKSYVAETSRFRWEGDPIDAVEWKDALGNIDDEKLIHNNERSFSTVTVLSMHRNRNDSTGTSWQYVAVNPEVLKVSRNGQFAYYIVRCAATSGDAVGWVKASDVECDAGTNKCSPKDNYTDAHKHGAVCAVYGIPVYFRPNGKPIGIVADDPLVLIRSDEVRGWMFVHFPQGNGEQHLMPYSLKALRSCG